MTQTSNSNESNEKRGWGRIAAGATLAAILIGGVSALVILEPWAKPPPAQADRLAARLELAAGEVTLKNGDDTQRLLSGVPLPEGAVVQTGAGARALIRLADGSRIYLDEQTGVEVGAGITLQSGRAWLDAPPLERGQEPTPHALGDTTVTLSEGGASLELHDGAASVYVAEGLAIVNSPSGRSEVAAGERAEVSSGGAPTVDAVAFWDDWTGGMGDRSGLGSGRAEGSGALYAVDRQAAPGSPSLPLSIQRQSVQVVVRDQVAETMVDQHFFNPSGRDVEGYYWFTVPEDSQLVSFALETNGVLVEGEIVERKQAAATYEAAVQRANDPALLEWIDARTVRARIFPVPSLGTRRIVVRYQQLMSETETKLRYSYPLAGPPGKDAPTIEEFSLAVDLGDLAKTYQVATLGEARLEDEGRKVTMRRSGYTPRADFQLELARKEGTEVAPVRLNMVEPGGDQARYVMLRYAPQVDFDAAKAQPGEVVVVVDTSAAGDPSEHQSRLAVAEALLRSLSAGDRFAVMSADVSATVLYPTEGLAEATPEAISSALESLSQHSTGGATDLGAIFEQALTRVHGLEQPAVVYIGDGLATSGERGGDALSERLRRGMTGSRARLFTIGVGQQIDSALLSRLARVGGGESLRVETPEHAVVRALELSGALKTPTITDLELGLGEGLDDVFQSSTGKLSRGQELVVLARTHHDLPKEITIRGRLGGEDFEATHEIERDLGVGTQLVPRLWAGAYVERLLGDSRGPEAVRGKILSLGLDYGLMTPYTSFLALDSEQAYARMGVQRRNRPFAGVRLTADASFSHASKSSSDSPGILNGLGAALTAPLGCMAGGADEAAPAVKSEKTVAKPDEAVAQAHREGARTRGASTPSPARQTAPTVSADAKDEDAAAATPSAPPPPPGDAVAAVEEAEQEPPVSFGAAAGRSGGGGGDGAGDDLDRQPAVTDGAERASGVLGGSVGDKTTGLAKKGKRSPRKRPAPRKQRIVSNIARGLSLPCSDASARGLAHRRILWTRRLAKATTMQASLQIYEASAGSCEVKGWKDERTFLQLLQAKAATEGDIGLLLAHFRTEPDAERYLARALMRRLVDPSLVAAVHNAIYGDAVDWADVDREVALAIGVEDKLRLLQEALARAPGDPSGEGRIIELLAQNGRLDDAIVRGRRLRDQGLMTPVLAQVLGQALVDHGDADKARRVFSEIVEFDPNNATSRKLLGDIFLRHGWYDGAYRQYEDLRALAPEDALAAIRLARAAAGTGRVDEALRLLRKVAAGEGRPGAADPRRFARLHAAAYLAGLLASDDAGAPKASLVRELRRLQLFDGPTVWTVLVWEDLEAQLVLAQDDAKGEIITGDAIEAGGTGLFALQAPASGLPELTVRHAAGVPARKVAYRRLTIRFDGSEFTVDADDGAIEPRTVAAAKPAEKPADTPEKPAETPASAAG